MPEDKSNGYEAGAEALMAVRWVLGDNCQKMGGRFP